MKTEQQQLAQDLYLNTGKTQQEIADILDVNRRTIYLWVKNGRWEEMKIAAKQAPGFIIQDIYNHIESINGNIRTRDSQNHCPTLQEVEMLHKLINIASVIQKKHTGAYIESFIELLIFINRVDPVLAKQMHKFADSYIKGSLMGKSFYRSRDRDQRVDAILDNLNKRDLPAVAESAALRNTSSPSERSGEAPVIGSNAEPTVIVSNAEPTIPIPDSGIKTG